MIFKQFGQISAFGYVSILIHQKCRKISRDIFHPHPHTLTRGPTAQVAATRQIWPTASLTSVKLARAVALRSARRHASGQTQKRASNTGGATSIGPPERQR